MIERDPVDDIQEAWARERPDLPVESIGVITRIWRIGKILDRRRRHLLQECGTDQGTLDLLATLRRAGPPYQLTPTELAERSFISSGGVSQRLARAEELGLITRHAAKRDTRSVIVTLGQAGHRLVDRTVEQILRAEQESLAGLTPEERLQLANLLRSLHTSLAGARGTPMRDRRKPDPD